MNLAGYAIGRTFLLLSLQILFLHSFAGAAIAQISKAELEENKQLIAEHRYKLAEAALETSLSKYPRDFELRMLYAGLLLEKGRIDKAAQEYAEAAEIRESSPEPLLALARIYMQEMQLDLSLSYAQQAVARDPDSAVSRLVLVETLLACNRNGEAERQLKRLATGFDQDAYYQSLLYRLCLKKGDLLGARQHLRKAIEADSGSNSRLIIEESELLQSMSDYSGAKNLLEALVQKSPDNLPARLQLARLLEAQFHDYAGALSHYEEAAKQDPLSAQALAGKERCKLKRRNIAMQIKTALKGWWAEIQENSSLWPRFSP